MASSTPGQKQGAGIDAELRAMLGDAALDPTRLVVDVAGLGLSGCAVERELRERHAVAPEMSDLVGLVYRGPRWANRPNPVDPELRVGTVVRMDH